MLRTWHLCGRSVASGVMTSGLLCVLLALAGCQLPFAPPTAGASPTPTLPSGWTWYHDSVYPFDAPIPPGWKVYGYWNNVYSGDHCQRKVDLVPPVSQAGYRYASPDRQGPEFVSIVVAGTCPDFVPAYTDKHLSPAGTATIDGATATLYMQRDEAGDARVAITRFGGRQYVFYFTYEYGTATPQSGAQTQLTLFATLLKGFVYHGK